MRFAGSLPWLAAANLFAVLAGLQLVPAFAQEGLLRPGEAYLTRFSGVTSDPGPDGRPVYAIDLTGTVASVIDLRAPGQPPQGQHWIDEPQRNPVTAEQVGQVFGVALADGARQRVFLAATSAFGLHRTADGAEWMPGMWGPGGPGAIYKIESDGEFRPVLFAEITLDGRRNSGPALGNIAYDRWNEQLFVSDLETGMIHRLRASDGLDLGLFDHGVDGRASFVDALTGEAKSLAPIAFDPQSGAQVDDCPAGQFATHPECWNFARSGRRVWGLGLHRHAETGEVRLYYSVWSSPVFGESEWDKLPDDERRNSVWSIRLGPGGGFDPGSVRREFLLPDFFVAPADIARAGFSQPVSDIAFAECGSRPVMVLAERGGIRNLGLAEENPFAHPHEARALRYELFADGVWRPVGRYDVGFYDRRSEGQPFLHANCSGGASFGYGYSPQWTLDPAAPDQFVWISGDALCSPDGPCNFPGGESSEAQPSAAGQSASSDLDERTDDSDVHGIQGMREEAFGELAPAAAFAEYPADGEPYAAAGLNQAYLVDADVNLDDAGGLIEEEFTRNDATKIGDVAVLQVCAPVREATPAVAPAPLPRSPVVPPIIVEEGHSAAESHGRVLSHGRTLSHYRYGSHLPEYSHDRYGSHNPRWSHDRLGSHSADWSHNRIGSHTRARSHDRRGSHTRAVSHYRTGSHNSVLSHGRTSSHSRAISHYRTGSHNADLSHDRLGSHRPSLSHARLGSHNVRLSHSRVGSHTRAESHSKTGSHNVRLSHGRAGSHSRAASHEKTGSHDSDRSHSRIGSHTRAESHNKTGSHNARLSHNRDGSHSRTESHNKTGSHDPRLSHGRDGSHSRTESHNKTGSHNARLSHNRLGSHSKTETHNRSGSHNQRLSHNREGSHSKTESHNKTGSHNRLQSHSREGSHSRSDSHARTGSHNRRASHDRTGSHSRTESHGKTGSHNTIVSRRRDADPPARGRTPDREREEDETRVPRRIVVPPRDQ